MSAVNFAGVIDRVDQLLTPAGRRWAVVGGVALAAYGHSRTTLDVDIVVELDAQAALIGGLEAAGYATLHRSTGFSNHRHNEPEWGRLDVIYVDAPTADRLFGATRRMTGPGGQPILVPKAEHLIAMKLHAIKNDPERLWQDLADIGYLLSVDGVDRAEARRYFEQAGLGERWHEFERQR